jgi:hypothetical protein
MNWSGNLAGNNVVSAPVKKLRRQVAVVKIPWAAAVFLISTTYETRLIPQKAQAVAYPLGRRNY